MVCLRHKSAQKKAWCAEWVSLVARENRPEGNDVHQAIHEDRQSVAGIDSELLDRADREIGQAEVRGVTDREAGNAFQLG